jgi:hypothetical protein
MEFQGRHLASSRRTWLKRAVLSVGAFLFGPVAPRKRTSREVEIDCDGPASPESVRRGVNAIYPTYPRASFVPHGYKLEEVFTQRPDGFGGQEEEVCYWYRNLSTDDGARRPLSIYVTPQPPKGLFGTRDRRGVNTTLRLNSGVVVPAIYHKGRWNRRRHAQMYPASERRFWNESDDHSLTYRVGIMTIGIRAPQNSLSPISFATLVRIAQSVRLPATL